MPTPTSQSTSTAAPPIRVVGLVRLPLAAAEDLATMASMISVTNAHFLSMALEYYETGEPMKIKCFTMKPQKTAAVIRLSADVGLRLARLAAERLYSPADICKQAIATVNDSTPSELFGKDWSRYAPHLTEN